jgi:hypothetical protein
MTEELVLSGNSLYSDEKIFSDTKRGSRRRDHKNKMPTIDLIIEKLGRSPQKEEKEALLKEFKEELKKFEPGGESEKFKKTAIYDCFKYYFDFYSKQPLS